MCVCKYIKYMKNMELRLAYQLNTNLCNTDLLSHKMMKFTAQSDDM